MAGVIMLSLLPFSAQAQQVPIWLVAAALSPLVVFLLCVVLALLCRSAALGLRHAGFVLLWIGLFGLASYWIENDYLIWTPLTLYGLHAGVLLVLVAVAGVRRLSGRQAKR